MIAPTIDTRALDRALIAIRKSDALIGAEFVVSGRQLAEFAVQDLKSGVAQISGQLKGSIVGDVQSVKGIEQTTLFKSATGAYDYAGRLDKDGRMSWRSGRFAGRKTFGWFSYVLPKLIKRLAKKYYTAGLERAVLKIVGAIGK